MMQHRARTSVTGNQHLPVSKDNTDESFCMQEKTKYKGRQFQD
jgi:hypothetical protein